MQSSPPPSYHSSEPSPRELPGWEARSFFGPSKQSFTSDSSSISSMTSADAYNARRQQESRQHVMSYNTFPAKIPPQEPADGNRIISFRIVVVFIAVVYFGYTFFLSDTTDEDREKFQYQRTGMHWGDPSVSRISYDMREYTARLLDVPWFYDLHLGCKYTPIFVKGKKRETPDTCERRGNGLWPRIYGHWYVKFSDAEERDEEEKEREESQRKKREEDERKEEEEKRRKEEERKRYRDSGMHWSEPFPGHCLQYNTREYSALLWDIPPSFDVRKGCEYTPIDINGETVESPDVCDDQGEHGMYGHWRVNFSEMACKPLWGSFSDLGCTGLGTGKHRVESRLWNLRQGDDWAKMCGTTPALIHNVDYPSPTYCDNRGIFSGMYGIWDIEDPACI